MPRLRIDCHVHTSRYSSCSRLDPDRACELAVRRGVDVLVFTEHCRRWDDADLDTLRRRFPGLTLLSGLEITLVEGYDVVVLGKGVPSVVPFPMRLAELETFLRPLRENLFSFVAHAFRYTDVRDSKLDAVLDVVDGMEMLSVNVLRAGHTASGHGYRSMREELYRAAMEEHRLVPVWTTDSHHETALGTLATELDMDAPPADTAALAAALCRGEAAEYQNAELLRTLFAQEE